MHVRPTDKNRTTLKASKAPKYTKKEFRKLRNIQKTNSRGNTDKIPAN